MTKRHNNQLNISLKKSAGKLTFRLKGSIFFPLEEVAAASVSFSLLSLAWLSFVAQAVCSYFFFS
jgi:hypothetical protein